MLLETMKSSRIIQLGVLFLVLAMVSVVFGQEESNPGKVTRVCAVCQSWDAKDRNLAHVLRMLDQAAARASRHRLPARRMCSHGRRLAAQAAIEAITKVAAAQSMMIAANLKEKDGDKVYSTSYLIGPDGKLIGKYRKSHRLPYESIALGDELPVFDTPLGKIGLMIGSDGYWPEVPMVLALQGAELVLWSDGPEPVPQGYPLDIIMRIRAFDNHVTLAVANYVGALPYLCSNWPTLTLANRLDAAASWIVRASSWPTRA